MLCPSCNKFAAQSTDSDPEMNLDVEVDLDPESPTATVTGDARIVLTSECCGDELKESTFEVVIELDIPKDRSCACTEFHLSSESGSITDRSESQTTKTKKDGTVVTRQIPYRYQKRFYGVEVEVTVACECGAVSLEGTFQDECPAGGMDEL